MSAYKKRITFYDLWKSIPPRGRRPLTSVPLFRPDATEVSHLMKPVVYVVFDKWGKCLYVGSGAGISRVQDSCKRFHSYSASIQVVFCDDRRSAYLLERELILTMKPLFNSQVPAENGKCGSWIAGRHPGLRE